MLSRHVRPGLLAIFGVWVLLAAPGGAVTADAPAKDAASEVDTLLAERLVLLKEIVAMHRKSYANGETNFASVLASEQAVLTARLELAKMQDERIAILEEIVESARELEEITTRLAEASEVPRTDMLQAKAFRLKAQAERLQEITPKQ